MIAVAPVPAACAAGQSESAVERLVPRMNPLEIQS